MHVRWFTYNYKFHYNLIFRKHEIDDDHVELKLTYGYTFHYKLKVCRIYRKQGILAGPPRELARPGAKFYLIIINFIPMTSLFSNNKTKLQSVENTYKRGL